MTESTSSPSRLLRILKSGFFLVVVLITLVALLSAIWSWRSERAWRAFRQDLESHGEKVALAEFVPPPVPDSQNLAMIPLLAPMFDFETRNGSTQWRNEEERRRIISGSVLSTTATTAKGVKAPPEGRWRLGHLTDLVAWQDYYMGLADFPHPAKPGSAGADVLVALDRDAKDLAALREGMTRPLCRFPIHYDTPNPAGILLPHLAVTKRITLYLELRAIAELSEGRPEAALGELEIAFRLLSGVESEPVLISYLVRVAEWQLIEQAIWEGVAQHQWNPGTLATLQSRVEPIDFMAGCVHAIRGERAFGNAIYNRWVADRRLLGSELDDLGGDSERSSKNQFASALALLVPAGFLRDNQLAQNHYYSDMLAMIQPITVSPGVYQPFDFDQFSKKLMKHLEPPSLKNRLARMLAPAVIKVVNKARTGQCSRDLALVGIALERYRLAKGEYPESLSKLVPEWVKQVPKDIYSGEDLIYRREGKNGVLLYSVGVNRRDDGGEWPKTMRDADPDPGQARGGSDDVVWRYPEP